jgi:S1-C subfamily serine protease
MLTSLMAVVCAATMEDLIARVDASVVTVRVAEKVQVETPQVTTVAIVRGLGSGVLVHADGWVVTAAHVVDEADLIEVHFADKHASLAAIVTLSRTEDLALLKLETPHPRPVVAVLGDSSRLRPGTRLFAIGAPLRYEHTVTSGIVSALRSDDSPGLHPSRLIQTDVPLNPGNSGGPLFDERGEVVGIASFIATPDKGSVGLNFGIPSAVVRQRLFEAPLPWIGVAVRFPPKDFVELMKWPVGTGMLIEKVKRDSPAEKAGLQGGVIEVEAQNVKVSIGGDVVLTVNGVPAGDRKAVGAALSSLKRGDSIRYEVVRRGASHFIDVPLPDLPPVPKLPTRK